MLSLLVAAFAAPARVERAAASAASAEAILIVDGWVLLAGDLEKVASYAA